MSIKGIHHVSFTVTDLERTVAFYQGVLGMRLLGRKHRRAPDLGTALFGQHACNAADCLPQQSGTDGCVASQDEPQPADILIADLELGDTRVEFIQYLDPVGKPYDGAPSTAGSAHIAILTHDIESEVRRLQAAGVHFHTPVRTVRDPGRPVWRWCYFRDPDGICVELVEVVDEGIPKPSDSHTQPGTPTEVSDGIAASSAHETVEREVAQLNNGDYGAIEMERSRRRLNWLTVRGHLPRWQSALPAQTVSPRSAFELLFFDYMGLRPEQVPVVEESEDRIVWLSYNDCPTLEACLGLGLDTRVVCRATTERPVQVFLSRLDPRLRFVRDYAVIRPHAGYCREQIIRIDLESAMREAINEALVAKSEGNKGYGCLVLMGNRVLARAHDTGVTRGNPSLHAEHAAILGAVASWGTPDLTGSLLISTCEPCPMCMGLAVWAGVTTVVFGSSIPDTAAMGRSRILVRASEIAERAPRVIEVIGGLLREECDALYR